MRFGVGLFSTAAVAVAMALAAPDAHACGGCFLRRASSSRSSPITG